MTRGMRRTVEEEARVVEAIRLLGEQMGTRPGLVMVSRHLDWSLPTLVRRFGDLSAQYRAAGWPAPASPYAAPAPAASSPEAGGRRGERPPWQPAAERPSDPKREAQMAAGLRDFVARHGRFPRTADLGQDGLPTYHEVWRVFGGLRAALARTVHGSLPGAREALVRRWTPTARELTMARALLAGADLMKVAWDLGVSREAVSMGACRAFLRRGVLEAAGRLGLAVPAPSALRPWVAVFRNGGQGRGASLRRLVASKGNLAWSQREEEAVRLALSGADPLEAAKRLRVDRPTLMALARTGFCKAGARALLPLVDNGGAGANF